MLKLIVKEWVDTSKFDRWMMKLNEPYLKEFSLAFFINKDGLIDNLPTGNVSAWGIVWLGSMLGISTQSGGSTTLSKTMLHD